MDPSKPQLPGQPGATSPEESLIGRGRSFLLPTGDAAFGRGRGFELLAPGGIGRGLAFQGLPMPSDEGLLGRARGLFPPAAPPPIGPGRGIPLPAVSSVPTPPLAHPAQPEAAPSPQEEDAAKKDQDQVQSEVSTDFFLRESFSA